MSAATAAAPGTTRKGLGAAFRREETRWAFVFLLPWIVGFLIFTAVPMILSFAYSITNLGFSGDFDWVGLANYERMFKDPYVGLAFGNTVFYAVLHVPISMAVALALALMLLRVGRAAGFFRTVFYLPTITPAVAIGVLWLQLLNGQVGLINAGLGLIGIRGPNWTTDPAWIKPGIILMSLWSLGSTVIIYFAALRNVPNDLYEAARIDGANAWQSFRNITVPFISGALFFTLIVNTIAALQIFTEVYTMYFGSQAGSAGERSGLFYVIYLFRQAFENFKLGYASALAWGLFVVILIITVIQLRLSKRWVYYEGE
jgi:multiple sugar transport system permease protein